MSELLEEIRRQILERFKSLGTDEDAAHRGADDLLLEWLDARGDKDIADAWRAAREACDGWWYA